MRPDDEALISIFYYLGYVHGMRHSVRGVDGKAIGDRESEKLLIRLLPSEVSALRFGADPERAIEMIKALVSSWKAQERDAQSRQLKPNRSRRRKTFIPQHV